MTSIPPYAFLLGAFIAWIGLMLSWAKHIRDVSEQRRVKAVARGETAPYIRGTSNYERAALRETAHKALHVTPQEKWIGRGLLFGIPAIMLTVFFATSPF